MPIRFRCKYCNQLIGIARRKAGTDVSCPTCHGRLTVPASDESPNGGPESPPPLFEQSEFEDYLRSPFSEEAVRHAAASRARQVRPLPAVPLMIDVERLPDEAVPAPPVAGILLTPVRLSVLVVAVILLLAGAFTAGIAVDRLFLMKPGP
jgi:phage FluMu protein Com